MKPDFRREVAGCLRLEGAAHQHVLGLEKFSARDWQAALDWLHLSGIALIFWDRLQKLGAEHAIPRPAAESLSASLADHRARVEAMRTEFETLNRQFESDGIDYALWKGLALVPDFCADACLRPTYDYDFLVAERDLFNAQQSLQAAGYVRKRHQGSNHHVVFSPAARSESQRRAAGYYSTAVPRNVELHVQLWVDEAFRIPLRVPQDVLDRKLSRNWQGVSFNSLAQEDALVFQTLHAFQHIFHNWCRLVWLWEIAYFLEHHTHDSFFWARFLAVLEGNDALTEVVGLIFTLAAELFHATLPGPVKERIRAATRSQVSLWVNHYGLRSALENFADNKCTLFLYREFVKDDETWRQILRSQLLPLHRPNTVADVAGPATAAALPAFWKQGRYVVQRLIHHSLGAARYALEYARWQRYRRITAKAVPSAPE